MDVWTVAGESRAIDRAISGPLLQPVGRDDLVDQPDLVRPLRADPAVLGHQGQLHDHGQWHPSQQDRRLESEDVADVEVGVDQLGVLGRNDQVRVRDLVQSATDDHPVQRADDRLPYLVVEPGTRHLVTDPALGRRADVLARGEGAVAGSGNDGDPDVAVLADPGPCVAQLGACHVVRGVQPLRPVDRYRRDVRTDVKQDRGSRRARHPNQPVAELRPTA